MFRHLIILKMLSVEISIRKCRLLRKYFYIFSKLMILLIVYYIMRLLRERNTCKSVTCKNIRFRNVLPSVHKFQLGNKKCMYVQHMERF